MKLELSKNHPLMVAIEELSNIEINQFSKMFGGKNYEESYKETLKNAELNIESKLNEYVEILKVQFANNELDIDIIISFSKDYIEERRKKYEFSVLKNTNNGIFLTPHTKVLNHYDECILRLNYLLALKKYKKPTYSDLLKYIKECDENELKNSELGHILELKLNKKITYPDVLKFLKESDENELKNSELGQYMIEKMWNDISHIYYSNNDEFFENIYKSNNLDSIEIKEASQVMKILKEVDILDLMREKKPSFKSHTEHAKFWAAILPYSFGSIRKALSLLHLEYMEDGEGIQLNSKSKELLNKIK